MARYGINEHIFVVVWPRKDHCWRDLLGFGWTKVKNDTQVSANSKKHRGQS